ncbi:hypothetical protein ASPZODRAFT_1989920 [Penicilliopsis zonata CBS 506.65]|uniref:SET domain-containing protein n=1 Tax=Penicilliopsis zonata CBS 506.65 TaxID=1073090 RepID=A0A1L9SHN7_9EURO|nr:hypothetical protein ASPZODRAFT_1989920 [Penicilliopsis zonata CBS 506.65]OJJ46633.1 hypothetical protein ASPZODRAFT_1989920 [Penicilliopsis zonata CBS 506.65]
MSESPLPAVYTKTEPRPAPNGQGTGLFATTDLGVGKVVLNIKTPYVAVLDTPRLEDTCSGCLGRRQHGEPGVVLKACTGCQVVKYCDRCLAQYSTVSSPFFSSSLLFTSLYHYTSLTNSEKTCQAKDWKFSHSLECAIFKQLRPRVLPNNARAVLRMVLRAAKGRYSPPELDAFSKLETHAREIRQLNPQQWGRIALSSKAIKMYSGTDVEEEVISACGAKLDLNSFNLTNTVYDRVGLYLHPYAALINHSCDYNSVVGFDGDELFVKAVRPIKKDDQIFISYIDTTYPSTVRRSELSERYFFNCDCSKCKLGLDAPEARFLSGSHDTSKLHAVEGEARKLMQSAAADDSPLVTVQKLKSAMHLLHETSAWPVTRQPYVSLRDELITALISAGLFDEAFIQAAIRYLRVDPVVYRQDGHPIRQVHAWALVKLAIHLSADAGETRLEPLFRNHHIATPNLSLLVWSVLHRLVHMEDQSCVVPSFKDMLHATFDDVQQEFERGRSNPRSMTSEINTQWEQIGALVDLVLANE